MACEALDQRGQVRGRERRHGAGLADGEAAFIEVADDGVGGADDARGSGLRGLADRVEALDGTPARHQPARRGHDVSAELPCAS